MDFDLLMLLKVTTTILLLPKQVRCMLTKVNVLTHTKSLLTYLWIQTMLIGKLLKMHCLQ